MPNETKNYRRERFLRAYANLPLSARKEIIVVLEEEEPITKQIIKKPITWDVAYLEVKNNTQKGMEILEKLEKLKLI